MRRVANKDGPFDLYSLWETERDINFMRFDLRRRRKTTERGFFQPYFRLYGRSIGMSIVIDYGKL